MTLTGSYDDIATRSCCGGGSTTRRGRVLTVDDGGTITKVAAPFTIQYNTTHVVVWDTNRAYKSIPLASTSFGTMQALVDYLTLVSNAAKSHMHTATGVTGTTVGSIPFALPDPSVHSADYIRQRLSVYSGAIIAQYLVDYEITTATAPATITFYEARFSENVQIFIE